MDTDKTFDSVEILYKKFPPQVYADAVLEITNELEQSYQKTIQKKRDYYNKLTSFKEKKTYYDTTLKYMEEVYQKCLTQLHNYRKTRTPQRYELWVTERTIAQMKEYGYRIILKLEISKGNII